jgi:TonB family protein
MFRRGTSRQAAPGFYVRMHVGADGKVDRESIQLVRGSGVQSLDQQILGLARAATFFPGQVGGLPATTWTVMPMRLF